MRKHLRLMLIVLILSLIIPAGIVTFAADNGVSVNQTTLDSQIYATVDSIIIVQDVLDRIKASDPANYDRNVTNYKKMLVTLRVHPTLKQEIEKLVTNGYKLPEILIGYEFLYHSFGTVSDLDSIVAEQAQGASWKDIFTSFNSNRAEFTPRTFESAYLEKLMNTPSLNVDDIMIADHIAFVTGKSFEEVIGEKQSTLHWQGITAKVGILFSADALLRVQITNEQMQNLLNKGGLSEAQITDAAVIAYKIGSDTEYVFDKIKAGYNPESIFAESYEKKYR